MAKKTLKLFGVRNKTGKLYTGNNKTTRAVKDAVWFSTKIEAKALRDTIDPLVDEKRKGIAFVTVGPDHFKYS